MTFGKDIAERLVVAMKLSVSKNVRNFQLFGVYHGVLHSVLIVRW